MGETVITQPIIPPIIADSIDSPRSQAEKAQ